MFCNAAETSNFQKDYLIWKAVRKFYYWFWLVSQGILMLLLCLAVFVFPFSSAVFVRQGLFSFAFFPLFFLGGRTFYIYLTSR
jgi:hypothetical protein